MNFLQFPDVNRILVMSSLLEVLLLLSCGPPSWQGGIHAQLAWSHKGVRVVEVPAESPARRADLREDDRILRIDGTSIEGLPVEAVHKLLSGSAGSTATLEVLRDGQVLTLEIVREPYDSKGVGF